MIKTQVDPYNDHFANERMNSSRVNVTRLSRNQASVSSSQTFVSSLDTSVQDAHVYQPIKHQKTQIKRNHMLNITTSISNQLKQFNQLKFNIQLQSRKNKALLHQNISLNRHFQFKLYIPQIKQHLACNKQSIQALLKQIDILLEEQNFLKKQKNIAHMKLQMIKQNQQHQCKNYIDQYLFLRNVWKPPLASIQKQGFQPKNNFLRNDEHIQNLNKKVVVLKNNIQEISKKQKDSYNQQQLDNKKKQFYQFRFGKFQHKESSLQAVNQKINDLVKQTYPFQKLKEKYQHVLMENQQIKSKLQTIQHKIVQSLEQQIHKQRYDETTILEERVLQLEQQNSLLRSQNFQLQEKLKCSQTRQFLTLLKVNQIQEKIYKKQKELQKYLYQEINVIKKYQISDTVNDIFYQLKITQIKKLQKNQKQLINFQMTIQEIEQFLQSGLKNTKVSQTYNGQDQKKQELRKCLSSGLLKRQEIDTQQNYAKQKFKILKKDSSRASLNQMRKHIAGGISDKMSEDIKKNKFVRRSLLSPSSYKKYANQAGLKEYQIQNASSQKVISYFEKDQQQQPEYQQSKKYQNMKQSQKLENVYQNVYQNVAPLLARDRQKSVINGLNQHGKKEKESKLKKQTLHHGQYDNFFSSNKKQK